MIFSYAYVTLGRKLIRYNMSYPLSDGIFSDLLGKKTFGF